MGTHAQPTVEMPGRGCKGWPLNCTSITEENTRLGYNANHYCCRHIASAGAVEQEVWKSKDCSQDASLQCGTLQRRAAFSARVWAVMSHGNGGSCRFLCEVAPPDLAYSGTSSGRLWMLDKSHRNHQLTCVLSAQVFPYIRVLTEAFAPAPLPRTACHQPRGMYKPSPADS